MSNFQEHNNRLKANKFAEYITGETLRRYLADKVKQYVGEQVSVYVAHDSWRGDVRTYQLIDDQYHQISRVRKRFPNKDDAIRWAVGIAHNLRQHYKRVVNNAS